MRSSGVADCMRPKLRAERIVSRRRVEGCGPVEASATAPAVSGGGRDEVGSGDSVVGDDGFEEFGGRRSTRL